MPTEKQLAALRANGFKKGQSGNPSGISKATVELRELARAHTQDAVKTLAKIMANAKASSAARVTAATVLLERGWGKPLQQVEVKRTPFDELSPEELRAVAEALETLCGEEGGPLSGDQSEAGQVPAVGIRTLQ